MKGLIAFVVSIVVSIAAPLRAGDIQVTGGYLDVSVAAGTGPLVLFGDRGFTFQANVVVIRGNFEPCNPCMPGSVVSLDAVWSGDDLTGVATLDGITYPDVGAGGVSVNAMTVSFSGSAVLPALGTSSTIVSAPFLLSGMFRHGAVDTFHGLGTATLFLSPHPGAPGAWRMDRVLYRLASLLPPPWDSVDIGAGALGFGGYVDGTFYVQGDGADIWGTADAFRFVYQPVAGDADIIARVTDEEAMDPFAKAGVMFRQSLDPSSLQVILDRKPSGELEFMTRFSTGDITTYITGASSGMPTWLRITRSGSQFTAFQSADGATWSEVGSISIASAGFNLFAGLAVTSHDNAVLNTSIFDHVTVTMHVSVHNLLQFGDFEEYVPPTLGPPGWLSDNPLRQVAAKSETNQPHSGKQNGACWTPEFFDCGLYQETGDWRVHASTVCDRRPARRTRGRQPEWPDRHVAGRGRSPIRRLRGVHDAVQRPRGRHDSRVDVFAADAGVRRDRRCEPDARSADRDHTGNVDDRSRRTGTIRAIHTRGHRCSDHWQLRRRHRRAARRLFIGGVRGGSTGGPPELL
jgi:hypothetical protein